MVSWAKWRGFLAFLAAGRWEARNRVAALIKNSFSAKIISLRARLQLLENYTFVTRLVIGCLDQHVCVTVTKNVLQCSLQTVGASTCHFFTHFFILKKKISQDHTRWITYGCQYSTASFYEHGTRCKKCVMPLDRLGHCAVHMKF